MNISIAIEKFDPDSGGAESYCWDFAHYLAEQGHRIEIICRKGNPPSHEAIHLTRVRTLAFPQFLRHLSFAFMHFLKSRRLKSYKHFCVGNTFYMDFYQPHGGVHRAWFVRETLMFRQPSRIFLRCLKRLSPKDMVQRAMEWWIFSVSRPHVIAISQMVASDIIRFFSFPEDRIHLVPNGVDTRKYNPGNRKYREEVRQRYGIGPEEYVFLFVAQNPRLKGYPLLVEACSALAPKPFRVLVVGPYTVRMKKAVEGLGDRMIFAGRADDLYKIYPACECLVHPTYYDSFSLVVLEALASGTLVITTHAAGAKMFITKENGMVIPQGDKDALVSAMNYFYSLRGRMKLGPFEMRDQESTFHEVEDLLERYQERDS